MHHRTITFHYALTIYFFYILTLYYRWTSSTTDETSVLSPPAECYYNVYYKK